MRAIRPTEARKQFFTLGNLAKVEPLLVTASTPFLIVSTESMLAIPGQISGVHFATPHPFRLPGAIKGPGGKSLTDLVSEGRR